MKKILAAGLAAALTLSIVPVASAQSSLSALSSSSANTGTTSKTQQVEDSFAKAMQAEGHTRHSQHDRAAEKAVQNAINGNVAFTVLQDGNIPNFGQAQSFSDGYMNVYLRFPLEHIDQVLLNLGTASMIIPGYAVPYGIAVDEAQSLVYVAFVVPLGAIL